MAPTDLIVLGSGFAGTLLAMIGARHGYRVLLLERSRHPRFAIGESSTPLANLLLEELAREHDLPFLLPLTKWGAWQKHHPELPVGIKRGFSFFHHSFDQAWHDTPDRSNQLLVAASPNDTIADTHWYRSSFDAFLVEQAIRMGVEYEDQIEVDSIEFTGDNVHVAIHSRASSRLGTTGHSHAPRKLQSRFIVDATHRGHALTRTLGLSPIPFKQFPNTSSCFAHFTGVNPWKRVVTSESSKPGQRATAFEEAPFDPDAAALHHVFPGGWIWVLPFNNGITSAGAMLMNSSPAETWSDAARSDTVTSLLPTENTDLSPTSAGTLSMDAQARNTWQRLLTRLPSVNLQFADATPVTPFHWMNNVPFQYETVVGPRWALVPGSAGFVDPMLSSGFPLSLLGVQRLARILFQSGTTSGNALEAGLLKYARQTRLELGRTATLIGALYRTLHVPEAFHALTHLYFAAASFAETARRLERREHAQGFLLANHTDLWREWSEICRDADRMPPAQLSDRVRRAIESVNVAGLLRADAANWYACRASDLLDQCQRLDAEPEEILRMLERTGFGGSNDEG